MFNLPEQFISANKAAIDNVNTITNGTLVCTERLTALNLNTFRSILEDNTSGFNALLAIKDPQALIAFQKAQFQPAVEKLVAYSSSVYEIIGQSVNSMAQVTDGNVAELSKSIAAVVDKAVKNAPAGSDVAVGAVKSALAAANVAYENLSKATKQVAETFEANVSAANAAAIKLVKKAA